MLHLVRMNQLLAGFVSVRTELINDNLVLGLLKALVEAIEGLVKLPGHPLYLEVHVLEAVASLARLLTYLILVNSGQLILILAEHSVSEQYSMTT